MQRESARRGFSIQHQKVALNIDLAGYARGYTEITIIPNIPTLRTIHLHSRECEIHSVSVAGETADYVLQDHFANLGPSKPDDVHSFPEIKRKLFTALSDSDEGALSIAIPPLLLPVQRSSTHASKDGIPVASGSRATDSDSAAQFAPVNILIHYSLRNPQDGIQFVLPSETYPYRVPHAYTTPASPDSARCWVPCVDSLWERHTWDLEFVVPKALGGPLDDDMDVDGQAEDEEVPVLVICSGELVEKLAHPHDSRKTIFVYSQSAPTSVQHIAFAVGPFTIQTIPIDTTPMEAPTSETAGLSVASKTPMHVFCLPGLEPQLRATTSFYRTSMNFFTSEYGSYPFGSHKLVFVDELPTQRFEGSTMSLVTNDLLHGDDAIEQVFDARHSLSHALACQWVGINIIPKSWADLWLINGLGLYITALCLRRLFGNNEYRFRLRKDMDRVVALDNTGTMPPICVPNCLEPPDGPSLSFINLKSPLVLYILDRRLAKSGTALGLDRVLPKVFLSAISGDLTNNTLSTHSFLRTCRKVSGVDVRTFSDQWIFGSGCPLFNFRANFNKKKLAVELYMYQVCEAYQKCQGDPVRMALQRPVQVFEGSMTIRIHEADGTPYEHVLDIRSDEKKYEILFNTKYKRVRRNTKRYLARKAAQAAAEAGDVEAAEAMELIDSGFELKEWENEARRTYWQVADWTEEDEALMNGASYEWIRVDADFEWIAAVNFQQADYMWVSQLQRDRDVVAQMEAINALSQIPTTIVSSTLTRTVLVTNYFYRIRAEAARLLIKCAVPALKDIGIIHLFKLFTRYCYRPATGGDPFRNKLVPLPNDFSDFAEYFVRKSIITAVSEYRDTDGKTGPFLRRFLIDQLHYNNNSQNQYSDALYVCTIIAALGRTFLLGRPPEISEFNRSSWTPELDREDREVLDLASTEVDRYREMDRLNPSPHNVVSIAVIEWMSMLQQSSILPPDWRMFIAYTREGNYSPLRVAAFEALILNKWFSRKSLTRYVFAIIGSDPSLMVRRFVARAAIASLGILEAVGDIRASGKDGDKSVLIEDDGLNGAGKRGRGDVETALKAIRKDAGKQKGLREIFIPTFLSPRIDLDTRLSLLKLGELIFRPDPEVPPKLSIKLANIPRISLVPGTAPTNGKPITNGVDVSLAKPVPSSGEAIIVDVDDSVPVTNGIFPLPNGVLPPSPERVVQPPPFKKKKERPLPKAQVAGLTAKEVTACRNILNKLIKHKTSVFFRQPVDPVRDHAPGYFEKIAHPMDLSNISFKVEDGHYSSLDAFRSDVKLVVNNAKIYNPVGSHVLKEAEKFDVFFDKSWLQIMGTLAAMGGSALASAQPAQNLGVPGPEAERDIMVDIEDALMKDPTPSPTKAPKPKPAAAAPPPPPLPLPLLNAPAASPVPPTPTPSIPHKIKLKPPKPKPPVEPPVPAPTPTPAVKPAKIEDIASELDDLLASDPPLPVAGPSTLPPPSLSTSPVIKTKIKLKRPADADLLLGELVDELGAGEVAKPRGTPSWGSKKKEKGKERERERDRDRDRDLSDDFVPPRREKERDRERDRERPRPKDKERERERERERDVSSPARPAIPLSVSLSLASAAAEQPTPPPKSRNPSVTALAAPAPSTSASPSRPVTLKRSAGSSSSAPNNKHRDRDRDGGAEDLHSHPIDVRRCRDIIKRLTDVKVLPESFWFLAPVDPIASGCPTYYDEIKKPMDFKTLLEKLNSGGFKTMEAFAEDMYLIFKNCRQFNPPGTLPVLGADIVEKAFKKEWGPIMRAKLTLVEKRNLAAFLERMRQVEEYRWFRDPVNVALLPNYNDHIPKRDMRDLGTMKSKLENDRYEAPLDDIVADVIQLAKNAHKYNGSHDLVSLTASKLEGEVKAEIGVLRKTIGAKRKGGAGGGGTANGNGNMNGNGHVEEGPSAGGSGSGSGSGGGGSATSHAVPSVRGVGANGVPYPPFKKIKISQPNGH